MDQNVTIAIVVAILAILAVVFILRSRASKGEPTLPPGEVHHDTVTDGAAVAAADIAGQFLGVDATPGPADDLTQLKGLGPKAQSVLNGIGVTRFDQLAALTPAQIAQVDAQMGTFTGRITRDQWVEQARLLATGDVPGFETKFGKLGG